MKPKFPYLVNLVVGDWSHDGHCKTEVITISSTFNKTQLERAYKKGTQKIGFDLTEDVCSKYEDMSVPVDVIDKLRASGVKVEDLIEQNENTWSFAFNCEAFAEVWLEIAKLGSPELEYEFCSIDDPNINIGGYGLLGS